MMRRTVRFTGTRRVEVIEEALTEPSVGQMLVETVLSAISAGTELLVYRGEAPSGMATDETIQALPGQLTYPLAYGYAAVGRVTAIGAGVAHRWYGQLVFAFQPHTSHFLATPEDVLALDTDPDTGVFLPNLETAVNLLLDGQPLIGERVVVIGQGVVGLLTTMLLARLPLADLVTVDALASRRDWSRRLGAHASLEPATAESALAERHGDARADLSYELSGNPAALNLAVAVTGYAGRVLVGSWYGRKEAPLTLGGRFHRSKMRLIASQVSQIAPALSGRWTPRRRLATAAGLLASVQPARLITHRVTIDDAATAYRLLDEEPAAALQVVLTYRS
ncbi:MAG: zinc-binding alcohol dehydrogenase [Chloroflexi bacterium]|nr:zinc-binding alcohol dehydrogenase [Chloroflexota bacterium]